MKLLAEQPSFAAGEISQELHARRDLSRNRAGARRIENGVVLPEGVITKAPGTEFIAEARDVISPGLMVGVEGRNGADGAVVVMAGEFARFYKDGGVVVTEGGQPYELVLPTQYRNVDLSPLRWAQSGDVLFFAGVGPPRLLQRFADTDWRFVDYENENGPVRTINTTTATITASAATGDILLTASAEIFKPGHLTTMWRLDDGNLAAVPSWVAAENVAAGAMRRSRGNVYEALNAAGTGPNPPSHTEGEVSSGGNYVIWRYIDNGRGYVKITAVESGTAARATVTQRLPATVVSAGTTRWYEPAWSDEEGWPSHVLIYDQKLVWAREDRIWITRPGDFYNFDTDDTDESAIPLRVTPQGGGSGTNRINIEWMLGQGILVIGGSTGEFLLRGSGAADQITASSVKALPDNSNGSAAHRPVIAERGALFIGKDRRHLYYANFERLSETVNVDDLTLFARHILKSGARDVVYQRDPNRIAICRLENGELRFLTFNPGQEVVAWSRRTFAGTVESLCVLPNADDGMSVWLLVRRTINGVSRRYIERMRPFFEAIESDERAQTATGAWFVDAGLKAEFSGPVTQLSNLGHLAGETVRMFCDQSDWGTAVVSADGTLTLPRPARVVLIGLPYTLRILPLPLETRVQWGQTLGQFKTANRIVVDVTASAGGRVRIVGAPWEPIQQTGPLAAGAPTPLLHGARRLMVNGGSAQEVLVEIEHDDALPFTFAGLSPALDVTGGL